VPSVVLSCRVRRPSSGGAAAADPLAGYVAAAAPSRVGDRSDRPCVGHAGGVPLALVLHLCGAACTLALGIMLVAVASVLLGATLALGGGAWLAWALRRA
jgi:hypothetical protein